jgi:sigma-B regulation protein RsbU (phosphoserine phosphatase)
MNLRGAELDLGRSVMEDRPPIRGALELPPGAGLCLYTDGLVERRDQVVDEGIAKLCLAVTNVEPEACCAAAMTAMSQDRLDADDVALLVFRRCTQKLARAR